MEAMAAELPVLCRFDNNLVGVIDNKINGFFYQDVGDFENKLRYVLGLPTNELDKIKKNALSSIDKFSEQTFYINIMEVYRRAIRKFW